MVKKFLLACLVGAAALGMTSCMTQLPAAGGMAPSTTTQTTPQATPDSGSGLGGLLGGNSGAVGGMLGSLITGLIGDNTAVNDKVLNGTWTYASPDCRFTSENALAQAGGEVAAATVEEKLAEMYAKLGIVPGSCSFTFNASDHSCVMEFGGRQIAGTYSVNPETRDLTITSSTGLIKLNAKVYYAYSQLTILFDANKLLGYAQMIAAFTGKGNQTLAGVSSILGNYNGMMIGMNLTR